MVESMPIQLSLKIPCYRASPDMVNKNVGNRQAMQVSTHLHHNVQSQFTLDWTSICLLGRSPIPCVVASSISLSSGKSRKLVHSPAPSCPPPPALAGLRVGPISRLRRGCAISAKSLFRAAYRCSEGRSLWTVLSGASILKMRSILALAVSSSFHSSRACR